MGSDVDPVTVQGADEDVARRFGATASRLRAAVHFVPARQADRIRIVAFQTHDTAADALDDVWPVRHG